MRDSQESRPATEQDEQEPDSSQPPGDSAARAAEVSAEAGKKVEDIDALIADVDETLLAALGFTPGEDVDAAERTKREKQMVDQYLQKGGQ